MLTDENMTRDYKTKLTKALCGCCLNKTGKFGNTAGLPINNSNNSKQFDNYFHRVIKFLATQVQAILTERIKDKSTKDEITIMIYV